MIAEDRKQSWSPGAVALPHLLRIVIPSAAILGVVYGLLRPGAPVGDAVRHALQTLAGVIG